MITAYRARQIVRQQLEICLHYLQIDAPARVLVLQLLHQRGANDSLTGDHTL